MSVFRQSVNLARSRVAIAQPMRAQRGFTAVSRLAVGKESGLHNEDRKSEIEQAHKKKDSPEWVEELASDSESIAKADRGEFQDAGDTIEQLAKETTKLANENKIDDLEKLKKQ